SDCIRHSFPTRRSSDLFCRSDVSREFLDVPRVQRVATHVAPTRHNQPLTLHHPNRASIGPQRGPRRIHGDSRCPASRTSPSSPRSEEHTSELQSRENLV